jgi:hypothetical protein
MKGFSVLAAERTGALRRDIVKGSTVAEQREGNNDLSGTMKTNMLRMFDADRK